MGSLSVILTIAVTLPEGVGSACPRAAGCWLGPRARFTNPLPLFPTMTVWLLPAQDSQSSDIRLFRVPDPRTRAPMTVAANASTGALYELQKAEDDLGSWFVGDSVKSGNLIAYHQQMFLIFGHFSLNRIKWVPTDGSAFLLTDLDPLFILVGLLRARSDGDRFISLSDILNPDDQDAENLHHLEDLAGLGTKLTAVCDHRDVPGYGKVYRLNKQKTMAWLEAKVIVFFS